MKDLQMKKEIVLLLRPMTKTSQLNDISGNSKEDVSDAYSVKWPFKMSAWRCLYMTCAYLLELPFFEVCFQSLAKDGDLRKSS